MAGRSGVEVGSETATPPASSRRSTRWSSAEVAAAAAPSLRCGGGFGCCEAGRQIADCGGARRRIGGGFDAIQPLRDRADVSDECVEAGWRRVVSRAETLPVRCANSWLGSDEASEKVSVVAAKTNNAHPATAHTAMAASAPR